MKKIKRASQAVAVALVIGITTAATADVKVRLKSGNDFKVENRSDSGQKFAVKQTGGVIFPRYALSADLVDPVEKGECYWNTTDKALLCASVAGTNGSTATWVSGQP